MNSIGKRLFFWNLYFSRIWGVCFDVVCKRVYVWMYFRVSGRLFFFVRSVVLFLLIVYGIFFVRVVFIFILVFVILEVGVWFRLVREIIRVFEIVVVSEFSKWYGNVIRVSLFAILIFGFFELSEVSYELLEILFGEICWRIKVVER